MDRSRYKRPGIQTQRLTLKNHSGSPDSVPEVDSAQPEPMPRPGELAVRSTYDRNFQPIDMGLPGEVSPARAQAAPPPRKARRFVAHGVALATILVITLGGVMFAQSYYKLHKVFKGGTVTAAALTSNVQPELLKGEGRGRINILLLGRGGGFHQAPDLTDTIMVASVDPVNHSTTLLSVPRDLWVKGPSQHEMKINAVWETGEFKYLGRGTAGSTDPKAITAGYDAIDQTLKDVLDIDIDYHVLVNFQGFKQAVDTVGGVDINVPTELFDPTMAWENNNNPVLAKAGIQSFNGKTALNYVRSRETSSDFARGERQRAMLLALKTKVVSLGTLSNPLKISNLLSTFGDNAQTDLSIGNANRLYGIVKKVGDSGTTSIGLAGGNVKLVTTGPVNGQSAVLPKAGLFNYADIQKYVRGQLPDPYILKEHAKITIVSGTGSTKAAIAKAQELKSYGYNVINPDKITSVPGTKTTLVDLTPNHKYTRNYLEQRFNLKATDKLPGTTIPTNGADFVIIIGSDEGSFTQNQTN